jgi:hypothetical protein
MTVIIDEPWRNHHPVGVDDPLGRPVYPSNFHYFPLANSNIAMKGRHARTIDDATAFDQQIIGHKLLPLITSRERKFDGAISPRLKSINKRRKAAPLIDLKLRKR